MSVIAEARVLAAEIVAIDNDLTLSYGAAFSNECTLGLTLAHMIVEGFVTRVDSKALALLDNALNRGRQINARMNADAEKATAALAAAPLDLKAAGPIFPVGTEVVLFADHWADQTPDRAVVVKAEWDGDGWEYKFQAAEGAYFVYEGDLAWHIEEFCADEI